MKIQCILFVMVFIYSFNSNETIAFCKLPVSFTSSFHLSNKPHSTVSFSDSIENRLLLIRNLNIEKSISEIFDQRNLIGDSLVLIVMDLEINKELGRRAKTNLERHLRFLNSNIHRTESDTDYFARRHMKNWGYIHYNPYMPCEFRGVDFIEYIAWR